VQIEHHSPHTLICLPHAGGSAQVYEQWKKTFAPDVRVVPIELPGHGTRFTEQPCRSLDALVERLMEGLLPWLNSSFSLFGHSMGSLVAYELCHRIRRRTGRLATHLFVSGRRAPHRDKPVTSSWNKSIWDLSDDELLAMLRGFNGTPEAFFQSKELTDILLPVIRADFEIEQTYRYKDWGPLATPVTAFGGLDDIADVPESDLQAWETHTQGNFSCYLWPGDHFFHLNASHERMRRTIVGYTVGIDGR
jgi:medium-chain acyl-[acyl-carrier-protein] hydrolase